MNADQTQRFLFDDLPVRGQLSGLSRSYRDVLKQHPYPKPVQHLLGEFMAAVSLLNATIKFSGRLSLQARGQSGQVRLLMAECEKRENLRAIARYNDDFVDSGPLLGEGQLAITLEPEGGQRYQGIVPMQDNGLAAALEDYFLQSEQIRTRVWLAADGHKAAGMLLQIIPGEATSAMDTDSDGWNTVTHLASTVTDSELLELANDRLLTRLFHEEQVRVFSPENQRFRCTCSHERSAGALASVGYEEARQLAVEQGSIEVDCQFCHAKYYYTVDDVEALFADGANASDDADDSPDLN